MEYHVSVCDLTLVKRGWLFGKILLCLGMHACRDESEWWIFPAGLVLCKLFQSQLINWHVANLEIQDRSLYSNDFELFWQS